MTTDNSILQELQGISPVLAKLPRQLPYAVPVDYFEQFPQQMLNLLQPGTQISTGPLQDPADELASLSPLLAGLSRKSPFSVPGGYFDRVPEDINAGLSGIQQVNEILDEALPPLLESARHLNPYSIPAGYFEQFPVSLQKKLSQPSGGAVVRSIGSSWVKYAAAAIVTGVIAISTWLYYQPATDKGSTNGLAAQLQKEIGQISDEAILEYTSPTASVYYGTAANGSTELNSEDLQFMLGDVSDEALQQYLLEQAGKTGALNN
ncbi:hypothetical protein ACFSQD_15820 [Flavihumibacter stibioxidans]|uniref:Uncharacterized protein n=1 Tax=Flavihumibacter stibioxidans TaxID=1834163 RepID=A0ABR7M7H3_9BACT|nr:hypothetical protein [Flavihumibacter stibioxidans]MBC6490927.1 hypothetical protein [Flavihumibacter stibioxidans]